MKTQRNEEEVRRQAERGGVADVASCGSSLAARAGEEESLWRKQSATLRCDSLSRPGLRVRANSEFF